MENTLYPPALEVYLKLIEAHGVNSETLLKRYHINLQELKISGKRLQSAAVNALWSDAEKLIGYDSYALDAYKYWHPSCLGALGYAWLSSSTLREGFNRLARYFNMLNSESGITVEEGNDEFTISYKKHYGIGRSAFAMSILLHMSRVNYQENLVPSKVSFWHPEPDNTSKYYAYFQCPVSFNAGIDSITFPQKIVNKELSGGNTQLAKLNDQVVIQYLNHLTQDDLIARIKAIIVQELPSGNVSIEKVAEELYMSSRNLHRKIKNLGTTYKKTYEECRRELAEQYVAEANMSITEISYILGFSEISSFSRSYKRWTGHSPNAER